MSALIDVLDDVRAQLAPDEAVLKEARERRQVVLDAARSFPGSLRRFNSGSLAHGTANCPVHQRDRGLDADCGVVLDRRAYPALGPDGNGVPPDGVVAEMLDHILDEVHAVYGNARISTSKRALFVEFDAPFPTGEDPTVDLIVALTRAAEPGLWIPNLDSHRWDPSHPEKHTELFVGGSDALRSIRARAVRLAKAENKRSGVPPLVSFNVEAFGLMFVESGMGLADALGALWRKGAADLRTRLTPDPAGVSAPIKVEDRREAVARLEYAASQFELAQLRPDDERWVRSQLRPLWPDFIGDIGQESKARLAASMKRKTSVGVTSAGLLTTSPSPDEELKHPRSYGA